MFYLNTTNILFYYTRLLQIDFEKKNINVGFDEFLTNFYIGFTPLILLLVINILLALKYNCK